MAPSFSGAGRCEQLYREAGFWNLESLRRAIEETQVSHSSAEGSRSFQRRNLTRETALARSHIP